MTLVNFNTELICGISFGIEFAKGEWIEANYNYLLVDILCFRFMFTFAN
jgi:hypothetical protein